MAINYQPFYKEKKEAFLYGEASHYEKDSTKTAKVEEKNF